MQVVGLDAATAAGFDLAAAAVADAIDDRGSIGIVRSGVATTADSSVGLLASAKTVTTVTPADDGHTPSAAIDRLADEGLEYALVDASLVSSWPTIVVGDAGGASAVASIPREAIERRELDDVVATIDGLEAYETLGSLVAAIEDHPDSPKAGAIATFTGRVRADNLDGERTTYLEYERYDGVAREELAAIREELTDRDGVYEVRMHHHTGVVPAEADAVYVVVLAGHRREAFEAVEDGIDLLKERVPIFKKEVTESGEHWAHDRP